MKEAIKAIIKSNAYVYKVYYFIGSLFLRIVGIFIKVDPQLILFVCYGGQKYDDSPRVVYEYLRNTSAFSRFHYVWAFKNPDNFPEVDNKVKIDTICYYLTALKAGYWITNSSASRGLQFKKAETKNILFQHGMAGIKKIGKDIQETKDTYRQSFNEKFDMIFIEGKEELDILSKAWDQEKSSYYLTGLPRNDDLFHTTIDEVKRIKTKLGIPVEKKVILYAPTFREKNRGFDRRNELSIPFDFHRLKLVLGNKYVFLVTAHYEVAKLSSFLPENDFVYNAFKYPIINDLLKIADVLVSDYSSVVFDYSILERPILCFGYDYDIYKKDRGFYIDLETLFSHGVIRTQPELEGIILNMDYKKESQYTKTRIKEKYVVATGGSAAKAVSIIFDSNSLDN